MAEWKLLAPHTCFNEGLEYDAHALYQPPTLRQKRLPAYPTDYINYTLICQPDVLRERLLIARVLTFSLLFPLAFPL